MLDNYSLIAVGTSSNLSLCLLEVYWRLEVVLVLVFAREQRNCGFKFLIYFQSLEVQLLLTEYFWHTVMNG